MHFERSHSRIKSSWAAPVLFAVSIIVYASAIIAANGFAIDDAYISARYAKNLAVSGQLTWNVGESPKTEGYTSPLWVAVSSLLFFISGNSSFRLMQLTSMVFGVLTLLMLYALARRLHFSGCIAALPPLFLSLSYPFVLWSASGMENALYTFLVLLGLYLVIDEEDKGLRYYTPLVLFLVFLTRTEGLVFYGAVVIVRCIKFILNINAERDQMKKLLVWNAIFLSCFLAYMLWKIYYYGAILPLPVYVKKPAGLVGLAYVGDFLIYVAPFVLLALLGLRSGRTIKKVYLWAALGAYLLAISFSNAGMGYDIRLLVAAFPLVYLIAVWELELLFNSARLNRANALLFIIVCFLSVVVVKHPGNYLDSLKGKAAASAAVLGKVQIPLGEWLHQQAKDGMKSVALADAGAISFYFGGKTMDFYGLIDREIAHKGFSVRRILERRPDYVILNSRNDTRFQGNYSPCGRMSEDIYASDPFRRHYSFVKQFVSHKPFYSLWVYERKF